VIFSAKNQFCIKILFGQKNHFRAKKYVCKKIFFGRKHLDQNDLVNTTFAEKKV